jgi:hypothetical protein
MEMIGYLIKRMTLVSMASVLLIFSIYWFELDDKLLRELEPTFRKLADWIKKL